MKGFDKFLLVLLALVVMLCCIGVWMIALQFPFSIATWMAWLSGMENVTAALIVSGAALIVFLICLRMFFAIRTPKQEQPKNTLVQQTEIGGTFVALSAIDSMVQKHIRANSRVRDCVTAVRPVQDGVVISARLSVLPDTQIVELTTGLQKSLKEYIESLCGIHVSEVGILVDNTAASGTPSRVD